MISEIDWLKVVRGLQIEAQKAYDVGNASPVLDWANLHRQTGDILAAIAGALLVGIDKGAPVTTPPKD